MKIRPRPGEIWERTVRRFGGQPNSTVKFVIIDFAKNEWNPSTIVRMQRVINPDYVHEYRLSDWDDHWSYYFKRSQWT